jgi:hypothetical protein
MNKLVELISDGTGAPSTMRVMSLLIVVPVMVVWTVLSIRQNTFVPIDGTTLTLVGFALGGKSLQSFAEKDPSK